MPAKTGFPVGYEDFAMIRKEGLYYVDKTGFIKTLLENPGKVKLFTRPRRFGKTLNMSMLKYFFSVGCDHTLFDGLAIGEEKELCGKYMGKFPVVSVSLKAVTGRDFEEAKGMLRRTIGNVAMQFQFLAQSGRLAEAEQKQYHALVATDQTGEYAMPDGVLKDSLRTLTYLLYKHYGESAVLLVDEYDVPLDKAYQAGYYDTMLEFVRGLFGQAFKTNECLAFAVLTGCLRISRESIFTGLNNFTVYTIKDTRYEEAFGFTDQEVKEILAYYGFTEQYAVIKEWYDGYQFGNQGIFCPWDVINYCDGLRDGSVLKPQNYWVNTSSNDIIRQFVGRADSKTRNEIETLVDGGSIKKMIRQELTYRDLDSDIDNLWSILFTTGYLTQRAALEDDMVELVIPNREIQWIFVQQIREWFVQETKKDTGKLERFCRAFEKNDVSAIETGFTSYLKKTISIRDTNVKKARKENFYYGILLGLFAHMHDWVVLSNAESGDGYSDIIIKNEDREIGIVIEVKYAENADFDTACQKALHQILDRNYEEILVRDELRVIHRYGIACYKKRCKVISG